MGFGLLLQGSGLRRTLRGCLCCCWLLLALLVPYASGGDCRGKRLVLNGTHGEVTDGPGNYSANGNCEWLITAPSQGDHIVLKLRAIETECSYDFLFIYDGDSYNSPLIASLSGNTLPDVIVAQSGKMLIHLFSDTNYNLEGFLGTYSISRCPANCSGHGDCTGSGSCACSPEWVGESCQSLRCDVATSGSGTCSGQGTCLSNGQCQCSSSLHVGVNCSLALRNNSDGNKWHLIAHTQAAFTPRLGAAGVFIHATGCLYVFGGFTLSTVLNDLVKYNITSSKWENATPPVSPEGRYLHTAVEWQGGMLVFGGELARGRLANSLWFYSPGAASWTRLSDEAAPPPPPGLAGHAAALVDDTLYIFGGRTEQEEFSSAIYAFNLMSKAWRKEVPLAGQAPAALGHSMVFYPEGRMLLVFGGHQPSSTRFSNRVNSVHAYHVDRRYWAHLGRDESPSVPIERAFHSAVIMGTYMVVYGGNVHIHNGEEKCFANDVYFYHLGCHQWVNKDDLIQSIPVTADDHVPLQGRFSHVAAVMNGNVLLVAGGYSGVPRGDLIAYKVPMAVAQNTFASKTLLSPCSLNTALEPCTKDPECAWCSTKSSNQACMSHQEALLLCREESTVSLCLGIHRWLRGCQACLAFAAGGKRLPGSVPLARLAEPLGWCVQRPACLRRQDNGSCSSGGVSGWWGTNPSFLTAFEDCRSRDFPPGVHWIKHFQPQNDKYPDEVYVIQNVSTVLPALLLVRGRDGRENANVTAVYRGFFHTLGFLLQLSVEVMNINARFLLGSTPNSSSLANLTLEAKISLSPNLEKDDITLPNSARSSRYLFVMEGQQDSSSNLESRMALTWNTDNIDSRPIKSLHLEPYKSGDCDQHSNCPACLSDQLCGWCPVKASCQHRLAPAGAACAAEGGVEVAPTLLPEECSLCYVRTDCRSCTQDGLCEWLSKDLVCIRRGRIQGAIQDPKSCLKPCYEMRSCSECLSEYSECAWCASTSECFPFSIYLAKYPNGQCRNWLDSVTSLRLCPNCSSFDKCSDCLQSFQCGWCWSVANPTKGRCLLGDFEGPSFGGNCSLEVRAVHADVGTDQEVAWSYGACPDVEECALRLDNCHANASCVNTPDSFTCQCQRGFQGDGVVHCNKTCYNHCQHGKCSGPPDFVCQCDLGWTSTSLQTNASGEECDVNCGCNLHSACSAGVGRCDECQEWTTGDRCQLCRTGSYGSAVQRATGCHPCQCNGHGDFARGECDVTSGACYCAGDTEGEHCDQCRPGFYGDPRAGGRCYLACDGRSFLYNVGGSSALGSAWGAGVAPGGRVYCVWVLHAASTAAVSSPSPHPASRSIQPRLPPPIVFRPEPNMSLQCGRDYVYVYDGVPNFLSSGATQQAVWADPSLIAAFCGGGSGQALSVEALSGILTVYVQGNFSGPSGGTMGFNATFTVAACDGAGAGEGGGRCAAGRVCQEGRCVCPAGYEGPDCSARSCPGSCGQELGHGWCHPVSRTCVCSATYSGPDCNSTKDPDWGLWELLMDSFIEGINGHVVKRFGHSLVAEPSKTLWLFGGYSPSLGIIGDLYRYNASELAAGSWEEVQPSSTVAPASGSAASSPGGRYFHAAAWFGARGLMIVVGGITSAGVANDTWAFNASALTWQRIESGTLPPVAGHTLSEREGDSLLLVGGYSQENGFNSRVYEYSAARAAWLPLATGGSPPTGLYGHTSVYHSATQALFVFGGYRYALNSVGVSDELHAFHYPSSNWSLVSPARNAKPAPRYFHAAALLGDAMVVLGGRTDAQNFSRALLLYRIDCNTWINAEDIDGRMAGEPMERMTASAAVEVGGRVLVVGGVDGVARGQMGALSLPRDPCVLLAAPGACGAAGCAWCLDGRNASCRSREEAERRGCATANVTCHVAAASDSECRLRTSCPECQSRHPAELGLQPVCKWCAACPATAACVWHESDCADATACGERQQRGDSIQAGACPEATCEASDCAKCLAAGSCMWSRHFQRTAGESWRINVQPAYNWRCLSESLRSASPLRVESSPPLACPVPCHSLTTCEDCAKAKGAGGGWQECVWSGALRQCASPSFLPMRCAGGACGQLVSGSADGCPAPCLAERQCSSCLRQLACGWCAVNGLNGLGGCMPGSLAGPSPGRCSVEFIPLYVLAQIPVSNSTSTQPFGSWAYEACPAENECLNGHNSCNASEDCVDLPHGFECNCKQGYVRDSTSGPCRPECTQGCVNGACTEPNSCRCLFGFVGENCSLPCPCNGHSDCQRVGARTACTQCLNNTAGDTCNKCQPLHVGSALGGGRCEPCASFCNQNSDVCMSHEDLERARRDPQSYPLAPDKVIQWIQQGATKDNLVCVNCKNNAYGTFCESCVKGYFLLNKTCTKCQCNGHWDSCNTADGTECVCNNNTETKCPSTQADRKDCWKFQCAGCKEMFLGNATDGRQCYRKVTVEQDQCFDPSSQSNCYNDQVQNLPAGRTVFFAVQPKFTNVDIRLTVDVTFGAVDIYVSNSFSTFSVEVNSTTGRHIVTVRDPQVIAVVSSRADHDTVRRRRDTGSSNSSDSSGNASAGTTGVMTTQQQPSSLIDMGPVKRLQRETAQGLITFITVKHPDPILLVQGVRDRLVITFPYTVHALRTNGFFVVVLGVGAGGGDGDVNNGESQGVLFFRQDQAHIDLFVFFSVFFSCFFLFLSVCVLLWKTKQYRDLRHERRRQILEMNKMASRPFARVTVHLLLQHAGSRRAASANGAAAAPATAAAAATPDPSLLGRSRPHGRLARFYARAQHSDSKRGTAIGSSAAKGAMLPPFDGSNGNVGRPPHHTTNFGGDFGGSRRGDATLLLLRPGPVSLEPTDDGMAAVATVMLQLPGGSQAPNRACLGSALVALRYNLQDYCGGASGTANSRKGGGAQHSENTPNVTLQ
ncbi:multiple epidermal growth factor-like domains protein 8 [Lethenteron reissneri]|uniref:multiple epidermal growth factor-like domains protein 8 n=1 Tax=Lethenteron reissneri TaxID=7753 RepID=UPI002AB62904|nr:multiple epidermal growth factor-like domains protein 8 [Lethenteron reissneri]